MSESTIKATQNDTSASARGKSVKGARALDSLDFRSRTTGADAAARSRLVRRLRVALPGLAVILIIAFALNTQSNRVDQAFLEDFKSIAASTEDLRMANPRFAGIDDEGKPYEITAVSASQDPAVRDVIQLDQPRAIQGSEDETSVVTAESGLFQSEENILTLNRAVTLEHELGAGTYILRSPTATVSIKDQIVTSDAGVSAEGPDGATLQADTMKAYREDGRVVFEGNVSMRLYPKKNGNALPALRDSEVKKAEE